MTGHTERQVKCKSGTESRYLETGQKKRRGTSRLRREDCAKKDLEIIGKGRRTSAA